PFPYTTLFRSRTTREDAARTHRRHVPRPVRRHRHAEQVPGGARAASSRNAPALLATADAPVASPHSGVGRSEGPPALETRDATARSSHVTPSTLFQNDQPSARDVHHPE